MDISKEFLNLVAALDIAPNCLASEPETVPLRGPVNRLDVKPSKVRSAVSNGNRAFIEGDGNSSWYRRFKDIVQLHVEDIGGPDGLSEAQLSLCRRAATMEVELERP